MNFFKRFFSRGEKKEEPATGQQLADVFHKLVAILASKTDLQIMEEKIMSAISDFSARVDAAFEAVGKSVDGIVKDIEFLKAEIAKLQNTAGQITSEDQLLLDNIEQKTNQLATKVKALDEATEEPPTPPTP